METWYLVNKRFNIGRIDVDTFISSTSKTLMHERRGRIAKSCQYKEAFQTEVEAVEFAERLISQKIEVLKKQAENCLSQAEKMRGIKIEVYTK